jgi:hypothetical protein
MAMQGGSVAAVAAALAASGCSLVLDWDKRIDAGPDMTACDFKEPNDTIDAATPLLVTEMGPAAICVPGDRDFYRFNLPLDGQVVTITLSFDLSMNQDIDLRLYDPMNANAILTEGFMFDPQETATCPGSAPACPQLVTGDYILEVFGANPNVFNTYDISITIVQP